MTEDALQEHLRSGSTTVCRAWAVTRRDGVVMGFTDHDRALTFDGITFSASGGLTARAVSRSTGLAVDNSETLGALSDDAIREEHVTAGLFDGATVRSWLVNWADPDVRRLVFRGSLGEIETAGTSFRAELRGMTEELNQPRGRVYQRPCSAVLGDKACAFDLAAPGYRAEAEVVEVAGGVELALPGMSGTPDGWFQRGALRVLDGAAAGAVGIVKRDREIAGFRRIELWMALGAGFGAGDRVRVEAGCDKRADTCRNKFGNFLNFRGFPDIPGEDWLVSYPTRAGVNDGGSLKR